MSNLETRPSEIDCRSDADAGTAGDVGDIVVEVLTARDVPLGGPRAMTVRRTLPQRERSLIGAWCFADHYGPDDVSTTGGMDVPPHPHTGLQTVSWLFTGEIEHRDTMGNHAMVRPGELNLMTAGHGIAHTEVSTSNTTILHGVQLWVALPADAADTPRDFAHYVPPAVERSGVAVRVFLGECAGDRSPVHTFTPLLGAELTFAPGAEIELDVDPTFEHGVLVDDGTVQVVESAAEPLVRTEMGYIGVGATRLHLRNVGADVAARVVLLGGTPLNEDIIMWWNFVGRTHSEIERYREQWQAHSDRFGQVQGYEGDTQHLPAPTLPNSSLRPRENKAGRAFRDR
ncbi:pirin family protein [Rhodococcus sp. BP-252]|uniref:Pirin n=1 Tax=Rhodococcoides kyotonense TaxID=398843 RepID=A0A177YHA4_9NOCA|nr:MULTISPECIES: pirin family protein [Rhodococcus]MBY6410110.1 pirin family protein [Rhodococcus sp. BP-320]MBY6415079.1 pirin family protein [Rhodococcus sp. BP-321]MBY6421402.1 pirin family protein [Rhodococcus sp. BP-324]MBY6425613.1 pirin family protein [Rhodococcus sp. BP-323]MBY6429975.1 pirin family protein [Rhodococcus sp. BP-322]